MKNSLARLRDIADINPRLSGMVAPDEMVSFVPMSAVNERSSVVVDQEARRYAEVSKGYTPFRDGDILIAKITPCFENGKAAIARLSRPLGFGSTEFHVIRPHDTMDARYLVHFLRREAIRREGEMRMTGSAGQRRVPEQFIAELPLAIPPIAEQRRIAEILDKADALRAKRRDALAQLDTLTQSIFLDMFGDPTANPRGWPVRTLSAIRTEFRYGTSNKSDAVGEPTLRIPNVVSGKLKLDDLKHVPVTPNEFERLRLCDGDLLFVRTNGNPDFVGRSAVFERREIDEGDVDSDRFIYASYLIRARLPQDVIDPFFLCEYLSHAEGRRQLRARCKTSAGQYNINTEGLGAISVTVPPLRLQHEFSERAKAVRRFRRSYEDSAELLDTLFASLQHRAFRGEL